NHLRQDKRLDQRKPVVIEVDAHLFHHQEPIRRDRAEEHGQVHDDQEELPGLVNQLALQAGFLLAAAIHVLLLWRFATERTDARRGYGPVFFTAGGFQLPSRIDGGVSLGLYSRSARMNWPSGAGSQFGSLSLPGDSCWMYRSTEPSALGTKLLRLLR